MDIGCIAYKVGMSSVQAEGGLRRQAVTLAYLPANVVTAIKTIERDGYSAIQLASCAVDADEFAAEDEDADGETKAVGSEDADSESDAAASTDASASSEAPQAAKAEQEDSPLVGFIPARKRWLKKPMRGHFAKSEAYKIIDVCEFRVSPDVASNYSVGSCLDISSLKAGLKLDVRGVSKGRGFAGGIRRWGFHRQPESHGTSVSHRAHGSTGQRKTPGKVFKGKKMAGHYGVDNVCMRNLRVLQVDAKRQIVAIKGAVPGARSGRLLLQPIVA